MTANHIETRQLLIIIYWITISRYLIVRAKDWDAESIKVLFGTNMIKINTICNSEDVLFKRLKHYFLNCDDFLQIKSKWLGLKKIKYCIVQDNKYYKDASNFNNYFGDGGFYISIRYRPCRGLTTVQRSGILWDFPDD